MALSSQGGLDFHAQRYDDPAQSLQNAFGAGSIFSKTLDRMDAQQSENEKMRMLKEQQEIDRRNDALKMNMLIDSANREKSKFDTEQNTLRATALGTTTFDKASVGQALLDKQASTLNKTLDDRIASLAAKNNMTVDQFNASGGMQKAVEAGAFKDLTGVTGTGMEDTAPLNGGSMAKQAEAMLGANAKNMQVQKQLIGEVGNQYFKEGQDGPMLYDPTSLNKYKQDLLSGLDTRIDREAARAQADAHFNASHKLALANAAKQNAHMSKMEKLQQDELGMQNAFQASIAPGKGKGAKVYPELKPVIAELDTVRKGLQKQAQGVVADFRNDYMTKALGLEAKVVNGKWTVLPTKASSNKNAQAQVVADMQAKLDEKIKSSYDPQALNQYSYLQAKIKNPEAYGMKWSGKYGDNGKPIDYVSDTDAYMGRMLEWANPANVSINPYQRKLALEYIANNKAAADAYRIKNLEGIRDAGRGSS